MLWAILAIVSAFIFAIVNLIDKIVVSKELKDPIFATFIFAVIGFIIIAFTGFFIDINIPTYLILLSLGAGIVSSLGVLFYYFSMRKEEVSSFVSLLSTSPIFVLVMAFFLLGERLVAKQYVGIFVLIFGAVLLANEGKGNLKFGRHLIAVILTIIILAVGEVVVKFVTLNFDYWSLIFWMGIGYGLFAFVLFAIHHPHIKGKAKLGIRHLVISNILSIIAALLVLLAISLGPVSIVSALRKAQPLFVFLGATLLTLTHPELIKEKISKGLLEKKTAGIIIIIFGAILVV
jgi:drug/metabolite transporter (DMT)-like permease